MNIEHARFMSRVFNEAGIPSVAVWSDTPDDERRAALTDLAARKVNVVFSVDLFNEGVDVPVVDTLLLLRPPVRHPGESRGLARRLRPRSATTPFAYLRRACGRLLHLDDMERIETYRRLLAPDSPASSLQEPIEKRSEREACL